MLLCSKSLKVIATPTEMDLMNNAAVFATKWLPQKGQVILV